MQEQGILVLYRSSTKAEVLARIGARLRLNLQRFFRNRIDLSYDRSVQFQERFATVAFKQPIVVRKDLPQLVNTRL